MVIAFSVSTLICLQKQTQALTHLLHRQQAELQSTHAAKTSLAAALKGLRTESQVLLGSHSADVALYEKKLKEFEQHALPSVFARIAEAEEAARLGMCPARGSYVVACLRVPVIWQPSS